MKRVTHSRSRPYPNNSEGIPTQKLGSVYLAGTHTARLNTRFSSWDTGTFWAKICWRQEIPKPTRVACAYPPPLLGYSELQCCLSLRIPAAKGVRGCTPRSRFIRCQPLRFHRNTHPNMPPTRCCLETLGISDVPEHALRLVPTGLHTISANIAQCNASLERGSKQIIL